MRRAGAGVVLLMLAVALAGCSTGPDRDDVIERFEIELDGAVGENDWSDVSEMMADHAFDGMCGSSIYWDELDGGFLYAWSATCSMHFEDDMTAAQLDESKRLLLEQVADSLTE